MTKRLKRGFTLIELLVVIAIIGLLSSIVLASLNSARTKGTDAAIKSDLNNIRAQAELYYTNTNSSYGSAAYAKAACPAYSAVGTNLFAADLNIYQAIAHADSIGGLSSCLSLNSPATIWAAAVELKTPNRAWCVDSSGQSKQYTGTAANAISALATCN